MEAWILPNHNVRYLDNVLTDGRGWLRVLPAAVVKQFPLEHLQVWCMRRAVYQIPTLELVDWLRGEIGDNKAIEICAGNGAIGRALGIPLTDSYIQTEPGMIAYYQTFGQTPIQPPPDVQRYEALQAVRHFRPEVVMAAWATQLFKPGDRQATSSATGVDEEAILDTPGVKKYIVVGNTGPHKDKRIRRRPHKELCFDWLISRARYQEHNRIYIWDNDHGEDRG